MARSALPTWPGAGDSARGSTGGRRTRDRSAEDAEVPDGHGFGGVALAYNARTREAVDAVLIEAEAAGGAS